MLHRTAHIYSSSSLCETLEENVATDLFLSNSLSFLVKVLDKHPDIFIRGVYLCTILILTLAMERKEIYASI